LVYAFNLFDYDLRGYAYFILWILAYHISGAEFNPAISIGTFLIEGDFN